METSGILAIFFLIFSATPCDAHTWLCSGLILVMLRAYTWHCLGLTSGSSLKVHCFSVLAGLREPYAELGIKYRSAVYKACILTDVPYL